MFWLPALQERLQRVVRRADHDAQCCVEIAGRRSIVFRYAAPSKPQLRPTIRAGGDADFDHARGGRCFNGSPQDGFRHGDRELHADVLAVAREEWVRRDVDLDQRVARGPAIPAGTPLPSQPQDLAVRSGRGDLCVQRSPIRQGQPLGRAIDGAQKLGGERVVLVLTPAGPVAGAASPSTKRRAENVGEIVRVPTLRTAAAMAVALASLALGIVAIGRSRRLLLA